MNHEEVKKELFRDNPELEKEYRKFNLGWWLEKQRIKFILWFSKSIKG